MRKKKLIRVSLTPKSRYGDFELEKEQKKKPKPPAVVGNGADFASFLFAEEFQPTSNKKQKLNPKKKIFGADRNESEGKKENFFLAFPNAGSSSISESQFSRLLNPISTTRKEQKQEKKQEETNMFVIAQVVLIRKDKPQLPLGELEVLHAANSLSDIRRLVTLFIKEAPKVFCFVDEVTLEKIDQEQEKNVMADNFKVFHIQEEVKVISEVQIERRNKVLERQNDAFKKFVSRRKEDKELPNVVIHPLEVSMGCTSIIKPTNTLVVKPYQVKGNVVRLENQLIDNYECNVVFTVYEEINTLVVCAAISSGLCKDLKSKKKYIRQADLTRLFENEDSLLSEWINRPVKDNTVDFTEFFSTIVNMLSFKASPMINSPLFLCFLHEKSDMPEKKVRVSRPLPVVQSAKHMKKVEKKRNKIVESKNQENRYNVPSTPKNVVTEVTPTTNQSKRRMGFIKLDKFKRERKRKRDIETPSTSNQTSLQFKLGRKGKVLKSRPTTNIGKRPLSTTTGSPIAEITTEKPRKTVRSRLRDMFKTGMLNALNLTQRMSKSYFDNLPILESISESRRIAIDIFFGFYITKCIRVNLITNSSMDDDFSSISEDDNDIDYEQEEILIKDKAIKEAFSFETFEISRTNKDFQITDIDSLLLVFEDEIFSYKSSSLEEIFHDFRSVMYQECKKCLQMLQIRTDKKEQLNQIKYFLWVSCVVCDISRWGYPKYLRGKTFEGNSQKSQKSTKKYDKDGIPTLPRLLRDKSIKELISDVESKALILSVPIAALLEVLYILMFINRVGDLEYVEEPHERVLSILRRVTEMDLSRKCHLIRFSSVYQQSNDIKNRMLDLIKLFPSKVGKDKKDASLNAICKFVLDLYNLFNTSLVSALTRGNLPLEKKCREFFLELLKDANGEVKNNEAVAKTNFVIDERTERIVSLISKFSSEDLELEVDSIRSEAAKRNSEMTVLVENISQRPRWNLSKLKPRILNRFWFKGESNMIGEFIFINNSIEISPDRMNMNPVELSYNNDKICLAELERIFRLLFGRDSDDIDINDFVVGMGLNLSYIFIIESVYFPLTTTNFISFFKEHQKYLSLGVGYSFSSSSYTCFRMSVRFFLKDVNYCGKVFFGVPIVYMGTNSFEEMLNFISEKDDHVLEAFIVQGGLRFLYVHLDKIMIQKLVGINNGPKLREMFMVTAPTIFSYDQTIISTLLQRCFYLLSEKESLLNDDVLFKFIFSAIYKDFNVMLPSSATAKEIKFGEVALQTLRKITEANKSQDTNEIPSFNSVQKIFAEKEGFRKLIELAEFFQSPRLTISDISDPELLGIEVRRLISFARAMIFDFFHTVEMSTGLALLLHSVSLVEQKVETEFIPSISDKFFLHLLTELQFVISLDYTHTVIICTCGCKRKILSESDFLEKQNTSIAIFLRLLSTNNGRIWAHSNNMKGIHTVLTIVYKRESNADVILGCLKTIRLILVKNVVVSKSRFACFLKENISIKLLKFIVTKQEDSFKEHIALTFSICALTLQTGFKHLGSDFFDLLFNLADIFFQHSHVNLTSIVDCMWEKSKSSRVSDPIPYLLSITLLEFEAENGEFESEEPISLVDTVCMGVHIFTSQPIEQLQQKMNLRRKEIDQFFLFPILILLYCLLSHFQLRNIFIQNYEIQSQLLLLLEIPYTSVFIREYTVKCLIMLFLSSTYVSEQIDMPLSSFSRLRIHMLKNIRENSKHKIQFMEELSDGNLEIQPTFLLVKASYVEFKESQDKGHYNPTTTVESRKVGVDTVILQSMLDKKFNIMKKMRSNLHRQRATISELEIEHLHSVYIVLLSAASCQPSVLQTILDVAISDFIEFVVILIKESNNASMYLVHLYVFILQNILFTLKSGKYNFMIAKIAKDEEFMAILFKYFKLEQEEKLQGFITGVIWGFLYHSDHAEEVSIIHEMLIRSDEVASEEEKTLDTESILEVLWLKAKKERLNLLKFSTFRLNCLGAFSSFVLNEVYAQDFIKKYGAIIGLQFLPDIENGSTLPVPRVSNLTINYGSGLWFKEEHLPLQLQVNIQATRFASLLLATNAKFDIEAIDERRTKDRFMPLLFCSEMQLVQYVLEGIIALISFEEKWRDFVDQVIVSQIFHLTEVCERVDTLVVALRCIRVLLPKDNNISKTLLSHCCKYVNLLRNHSFVIKAEESLLDIVILVLLSIFHNSSSQKKDSEVLIQTLTEDDNVDLLPNLFKDVQENQSINLDLGSRMYFLEVLLRLIIELDLLKKIQNEQMVAVLYSMITRDKSDGVESNQNRQSRSLLCRALCDLVLCDCGLSWFEEVDYVLNLMQLLVDKKSGSDEIKSILQILLKLCEANSNLSKYLGQHSVGGIYYLCYVLSSFTDDLSKGSSVIGKKEENAHEFEQQQDSHTEQSTNTRILLEILCRRKTHPLIYVSKFPDAIYILVIQLLKKVIKNWDGDIEIMGCGCAESLGCVDCCPSDLFRKANGMDTLYHLIFAKRITLTSSFSLDEFVDGIDAFDVIHDSIHILQYMTLNHLNRMKILTTSADKRSLVWDEKFLPVFRRLIRLLRDDFEFQITLPVIRIFAQYCLEGEFAKYLTGVHSTDEGDIESCDVVKDIVCLWRRTNSNWIHRGCLVVLCRLARDRKVFFEGSLCTELKDISLWINNLNNDLTAICNLIMLFRNADSIEKKMHVYQYADARFFRTLGGFLKPNQQNFVRFIAADALVHVCFGCLERSESNKSNDRIVTCDELEVDNLFYGDEAPNILESLTSISKFYTRNFKERDINNTNLVWLHEQMLHVYEVVYGAENKPQLFFDILDLNLNAVVYMNEFLSNNNDYSFLLETSSLHDLSNGSLASWRALRNLYNENIGSQTTSCRLSPDLLIKVLDKLLVSSKQFSKKKKVKVMKRKVPSSVPEVIWLVHDIIKSDPLFQTQDVLDRVVPIAQLFLTSSFSIVHQRFLGYVLLAPFINNSVLMRQLSNYLFGDVYMTGNITQERSFIPYRLREFFTGMVPKKEKIYLKINRLAVSKAYELTHSSTGLIAQLDEIALHDCKALPYSLSLVNSMMKVSPKIVRHFLDANGLSSLLEILDAFRNAKKKRAIFQFRVLRSCLEILRQLIIYYPNIGLIVLQKNYIVAIFSLTYHVNTIVQLEAFKLVQELTAISEARNALISIENLNGMPILKPTAWLRADFKNDIKKVYQNVYDNLQHRSSDVCAYMSQVILFRLIPRNDLIHLCFSMGKPVAFQARYLKESFTIIQEGNITFSSQDNSDSITKSEGCYFNIPSWLCLGPDQNSSISKTKVPQIGVPDPNYYPNIEVTKNTKVFLLSKSTYESVINPKLRDTVANDITFLFGLRKKSVQHRGILSRMCRVLGEDERHFRSLMWNEKDVNSMQALKNIKNTRLFHFLHENIVFNKLPKSNLAAFFSTFDTPVSFEEKYLIQNCFVLVNQGSVSLKFLSTSSVIRCGHGMVIIYPDWLYNPTKEVCSINKISLIHAQKDTEVFILEKDIFLKTTSTNDQQIIQNQIKFLLENSSLATCASGLIENFGELSVDHAKRDMKRNNDIARRKNLQQRKLCVLLVIRNLCKESSIIDTILNNTVLMGELFDIAASSLDYILVSESISIFCVLLNRRETCTKFIHLYAEKILLLFTTIDSCIIENDVMECLSKFVWQIFELDESFSKLFFQRNIWGKLHYVSLKYYFQFMSSVCRRNIAGILSEICIQRPEIISFLGYACVGFECLVSDLVMFYQSNYELHQYFRLVTHLSRDLNNRRNIWRKAIFHKAINTNCTLKKLCSIGNEFRELSFYSEMCEVDAQAIKFKRYKKRKLTDFLAFVGLLSHSKVDPTYDKLYRKTLGETGIITTLTYAFHQLRFLKSEDLLLQKAILQCLWMVCFEEVENCRKVCINDSKSTSNKVDTINDLYVILTTLKYGEVTSFEIEALYAVSTFSLYSENASYFGKLSGVTLLKDYLILNKNHLWKWINASDELDTANGSCIKISSTIISKQVILTLCSLVENSPYKNGVILAQNTGIEVFMDIAMEGILKYSTSYDIIVATLVLISLSIKNVQSNRTQLWNYCFNHEGESLHIVDVFFEYLLLPSTGIDEDEYIIKIQTNIATILSELCRDDDVAQAIVYHKDAKKVFQMYLNDNFRYIDSRRPEILKILLNFAEHSLQNVLNLFRCESLIANSCHIFIQLMDGTIRIDKPSQGIIWRLNWLLQESLREEIFTLVNGMNLNYISDCFSKLSSTSMMIFNGLGFLYEVFCAGKEINNGFKNEQVEVILYSMHRTFILFLQKYSVSDHIEDFFPADSLWSKSLSFCQSSIAEYYGEEINYKAFCWCPAVFEIGKVHKVCQILNLLLRSTIQSSLWSMKVFHHFLQQFLIPKVKDILDISLANTSDQQYSFFINMQKDSMLLVLALTSFEPFGSDTNHIELLTLYQNAMRESGILMTLVRKLKDIQTIECIVEDILNCIDKIVTKNSVNCNEIGKLDCNDNNCINYIKSILLLPKVSSSTMDCCISCIASICKCHYKNASCAGSIGIMEILYNYASVDNHKAEKHIIFSCINDLICSCPQNTMHLVNYFAKSPDKFKYFYTIFKWGNEESCIQIFNFIYRMLGNSQFRDIVALNWMNFEKEVVYNWVKLIRSSTNSNLQNIGSKCLLELCKNDDIIAFLSKCPYVLCFSSCMVEECISFSERDDSVVQFLVIIGNIINWRSEVGKLFRSIICNLLTGFRDAPISVKKNTLDILSGIIIPQNLKTPGLLSIFKLNIWRPIIQEIEKMILTKDDQIVYSAVQGLNKLLILSLEISPNLLNPQCVQILNSIEIHFADIIPLTLQEDDMASFVLSCLNLNSNKFEQKLIEMTSMLSLLELSIGKSTYWNREKYFNSHSLYFSFACLFLKLSNSSNFQYSSMLKFSTFWISYITNAFTSPVKNKTTRLNLFFKILMKNDVLDIVLRVFLNIHYSIEYRDVAQRLIWQLLTSTINALPSINFSAQKVKLNLLNYVETSIRSETSSLLLESATGILTELCANTSFVHAFIEREFISILLLLLSSIQSNDETSISIELNCLKAVERMILVIASSNLQNLEDILSKNDNIFAVISSFVTRNESVLQSEAVCILFVLCQHNRGVEIFKELCSIRDDEKCNILMYHLALLLDIIPRSNFRPLRAAMYLVQVLCEESITYAYVYEESRVFLQSSKYIPETHFVLLMSSVIGKTIGTQQFNDESLICIYPFSSNWWPKIPMDDDNFILPTACDALRTLLKLSEEGEFHDIIVSDSCFIELLAVVACKNIDISCLAVKIICETLKCNHFDTKLQGKKTTSQLRNIPFLSNPSKDIFHLETSGRVDFPVFKHAHLTVLVSWVIYLIQFLSENKLSEGHRLNDDISKSMIMLYYVIEMVTGLVKTHCSLFFDHHQHFLQVIYRVITSDDFDYSSQKNILVLIYELSVRNCSYIFFRSEAVLARIFSLVECSNTSVSRIAAKLINAVCKDKISREIVIDSFLPNILEFMQSTSCIHIRESILDTLSKLVKSHRKREFETFFVPSNPTHVEYSEKNNQKLVFSIATVNSDFSILGASCILNIKYKTINGGEASHKRYLGFSQAQVVDYDIEASEVLCLDEESNSLQCYSWVHLPGLKDGDNVIQGRLEFCNDSQVVIATGGRFEYALPTENSSIQKIIDLKSSDDSSHKIFVRLNIENTINITQRNALLTPVGSLLDREIANKKYSVIHRIISVLDVFCQSQPVFETFLFEEFSILSLLSFILQKSTDECSQVKAFKCLYSLSSHCAIETKLGALRGVSALLELFPKVKEIGFTLSMRNSLVTTEDISNQHVCLNIEAVEAQRTMRCEKFATLFVQNIAKGIVSLLCRTDKVVGSTKANAVVTECVNSIEIFFENIEVLMYLSSLYSNSSICSGVLEPLSQLASRSIMARYLVNSSKLQRVCAIFNEFCQYSRTVNSASKLLVQLCKLKETRVLFIENNGMHLFSRVSYEIAQLDKRDLCEFKSSSNDSHLGAQQNIMLAASYLSEEKEPLLDQVIRSSSGSNSDLLSFVDTLLYPLKKGSQNPTQPPIIALHTQLTASILCRLFERYSNRLLFIEELFKTINSSDELILVNKAIKICIDLTDWNYYSDLNLVKYIYYVAISRGVKLGFLDGAMKHLLSVYSEISLIGDFNLEKDRCWVAVSKNLLLYCCKFVHYIDKVRKRLAANNGKKGFEKLIEEANKQALVLQTIHQVLYLIYEGYTSLTWLDRNGGCNGRGPYREDIVTLRKFLMHVEEFGALFCSFLAELDEYYIIPILQKMYNEMKKICTAVPENQQVAARDLERHLNSIFYLMKTMIKKGKVFGVTEEGRNIIDVATLRFEKLLLYRSKILRLFLAVYNSQSEGMLMDVWLSINCVLHRNKLQNSKQLGLLFKDLKSSNSKKTSLKDTILKIFKRFFCLRKKENTKANLKSKMKSKFQLHRKSFIASTTISRKPPEVNLPHISLLSLPIRHNREFYEISDIEKNNLHVKLWRFLLKPIERVRLYHMYFVLHDFEESIVPTTHSFGDEKNKLFQSLQRILLKVKRSKLHRSRMINITGSSSSEEEEDEDMNSHRKFGNEKRTEETGLTYFQKVLKFLHFPLATTINYGESDFDSMDTVELAMDLMKVSEKTLAEGFTQSNPLSKKNQWEAISHMEKPAWISLTYNNSNGFTYYLAVFKRLIYKIVLGVAIWRWEEYSIEYKKLDYPGDVFENDEEYTNFVIFVQVIKAKGESIRIWMHETGTLGLRFWHDPLYSVIGILVPVVMLYVILPILNWKFNSVDYYVAPRMALIVYLYILVWIVLVMLSIYHLARKGKTYSVEQERDTLRLSPVFTYYQNHFAIILILVEVMQQNALSLSEEVEWEESYTLPKVASFLKGIGLTGISIPIVSMKGYVSLGFLILWILLLKSANKFHNNSPALNNAVTKVIPKALCGAFYMGLTSSFFSLLACKIPSNENTKSYLIQHDSIQCWSDDHKPFAFVGLLGVAFYIPIASLGFGMSQVLFQDVKLDIKFAPVIVMISQLVKALMAASSIFFSEQQMVFITTGVVGNLFLFLMMMFMKSASLWYVRIIKCAIYFGSFWCGICAIYTSNTTKKWSPIYYLHFGWLFTFVMTIIVLMLVFYNRSKNKETRADFINLLSQQPKSNEDELILTPKELYFLAKANTIKINEPQLSFLDQANSLSVDDVPLELEQFISRARETARNPSHVDTLILRRSRRLGKQIAATQKSKDDKKKKKKHKN